MTTRLKPYIVRQGDYLSRLAYMRGFVAEDVWNAPENEALRNLRKNMDVLAPGDIVYLPDSTSNALPITKGATNRYIAKVPRVEVTLVFRDGEAPLANEAFEVNGATATAQATDGEGAITLRVPVTTREVSVRFPRTGAVYNVRVGDLDPESEASGIRKRLAHLGFLPDTLGPEADEAEAIRVSVAAFQATHGLEPTGEVDEATRKALVDAHQQ